MKRKRKFSTGEGVYEGDGYAGVEKGMGGGAGYQGEGEYGPDVSGGNKSKPGESIESQTEANKARGSTSQFSDADARALEAQIAEINAQQWGEQLGKLGTYGQLAKAAGLGAALSKADMAGVGYGTAGSPAREGSGDVGENGDRRPGDTASDVKPFGSDAPTGTTKMEDEKGTGEKKYRWDPKLRQYVLENLGAGANPMGYRQGQVFQMAQGGQVPRSFAAGGYSILPEDQRVGIIAEANRRAIAAGTSVEVELAKYATSQGLSISDAETLMGYPAGTLGGQAATGTAAGTGSTAGAGTAATGIAAGAGTAATPATGAAAPLGVAQQEAVTAEAHRRAAISGLPAQQELINYVTGLGYTMSDLDTWMGYPAGTAQTWVSQNPGGNMVVQGPAQPPMGPSPDPTVDRTVTPAPGPAPYAPLDPTSRTAVITEAQRRAGISGRTPQRELYNYASQQPNFSHEAVDQLLGYAPGSTDAWWAQQAGGGRDALANGGGGYGGGGSNFNNGGLDGLGIRNADGTRTLLGGVNDNAQDSRQYGWRTGLQAVAPAQQGPYIRGMAAGGIAAGAPAPRFVSGGGTGLSDEVPVTMDDGGAGRLADGEFVITADVVSGLGGGSSKAGAKMLYDMMERVRQQAHGSKKQIRPVDPKRVLPA